MKKIKILILLTCFGMSLHAAMSSFEDRFNRPDSTTVGNGWTENTHLIDDVVIDNKAMLFAGNGSVRRELNFNPNENENFEAEWTMQFEGDHFEFIWFSMSITEQDLLDIYSANVVFSDGESFLAWGHSENGGTGSSASDSFAHISLEEFRNPHRFRLVADNGEIKLFVKKLGGRYRLIAEVPGTLAAERISFRFSFGEVHADVRIDDVSVKTLR